MPEEPVENALVLEIVLRAHNQFAIDHLVM